MKRMHYHYFVAKGLITGFSLNVFSQEALALCGTLPLSNCSTNKYEIN